MWNFIWLDIDSSLQTNDSKWLDSSCNSTLTRPSHYSILTRLENILDDSDSKSLWLWLDKNDLGISLQTWRVCLQNMFTSRDLLIFITYYLHKTVTQYTSTGASNIFLVFIVANKYYFVINVYQHVLCLCLLCPTSKVSLAQGKSNRMIPQFFQIRWCKYSCTLHFTL